jgi:hypothetical protein
MSDPFQHALAGYDEQFERKLVDAITEAIASTSMLTDADVHPVIALRLGETANALTTVLAAALALSPVATRSPKAIRQLADGFRRKLTARVRQAELDPLFADFKNRAFGSDVADHERGGNA